MRTAWRGRPLALWALLVLLATLGVRALVGGGQFIVEPSGAIVGVSTAVLAGTPLEDFLLPGLFLFVALGVFPLAVSYGLYRGDAWAWMGSIAVAVVLFAWAIAEGFVIGFGERLQYVNLLQAVLMALLAAWPPVRERYR